MATHVNLMECWGDDGPAAQRPLQAVRLDANETAVVPFTTDVEQARLHYCDMADVRGYVHCNGPACALCRAGRKPDERVLLPVYLPAAQAVAVLPVSPSSRPGALRPQIMPALRSGKRVALLISKPDAATFRVSTVDLTDGVDDGAQAVRDFLQRRAAGLVELGSVYQRIDDRDLAAVPEVAAMLRLKGVRP